MDKTHTKRAKDYFDKIAEKRDYWKKRNWFYHQQIERLYKFLIPENKKVLEIGCGTGDLLSSLKPLYGVGIDISGQMVKIAQKKYPRLKFIPSDAQNLPIQENFDYIILSDVIGNLEDVQKAFEELAKVSDEKTRIIINYYNHLWEPFLILAEKLGLKMPQLIQNWLSQKDIENLLELANLEVIKKGNIILIPFFIPFFSNFINKYLAKFPLLKHLCLSQYFITRKKPNTYSDDEYSVSVVIPARNEAGNIEQAVIRTPKLGSKTKLIFVEGHSKDNTREEIKRVIKKYKNKREILLVNQGKGVGKGDAVRKGFAKATGDILIILDADLTVPPEELPKFYQVLRLQKGEYVQGSRLVYPMEKQAMRLLNIFGNKFFSLAFTWFLDQPIKDTLCGTKAIFKRDYEEIAKNRSYFGNFDPFGDFDLIFGASKLNLKIIEIPVRYRARVYGETNISRFKHGWLLLKMTLFAARKIKFI